MEELLPVSQEVNEVVGLALFGVALSLGVYVFYRFVKDEYNFVGNAVLLTVCLGCWAAKPELGTAAMGAGTIAGTAAVLFHWLWQRDHE